MAERDYVLGTHDAEIERLGLQHRVWRPYALDAWRRAGITIGQRVIDFGAGPGFASIDLADIVGPTGEIIALERSARFAQSLRARAAQHGAAQVNVHEIDLAADALPVSGADAAWARWIFAFLPSPQAALARLAAALKPGGTLVVHEYLDYATWRLCPRSAPFERFVTEVMASWRAAGGEPNVGFDMLGWLEAAGFAPVAQKTIVEVITPRDFMWHWPASFLETNLDRLVATGRMSAADATAAKADFARIEATPGARMATPVVMELIARKLA